MANFDGSSGSDNQGGRRRQAEERQQLLYAKIKAEERRTKHSQSPRFEALRLKRQATLMQQREPDSDTDALFKQLQRSDEQVRKRPSVHLS
jgi:hypothetical protein